MAITTATTCIVDDDRSWRWMTVTSTTTTATCATTTWYSDYYTVSNYTMAPYEPPKPPPEYVALQKVVLGRHHKPQMVVGRVMAAAFPRGKLSRWKSLKEKRASWGIN